MNYSNGKPICTIPRIMCWAIDNIELLKSQPNDSVDLICCNIPTIENHYIPRIKEMHRVLKRTGSIYLKMECSTTHYMRCIMDDIFGGNFRNEIIWYYRIMETSTKSFKEKHDNILFYTKSNDYTFNFDNVRTGCYVANNQFTRENVGYATRNPKTLFERIIKASSNEGDTVADYYLGIGTTAEVCKELNRNFIGCDINPKAIEITKSRLNSNNLSN
jgi:DNA modification methylase